ncbi:MAG: hypothetical protein WBV94_19570 [Blastocatellia bacterium]
MTTDPKIINYTGFETPQTGARYQMREGRLVLGFVFFQIACQFALLSNNIGPLRLFVRMATFFSSIVMLFVLQKRGAQHPSIAPALWILGLVFLSLFYPTTNVVAGFAQAAMYLAILAPLFWASRLKIDLPTLRKIILVLWAFYTLSAIFGVLQVYFPGRFQPNLSSVYASMDKGYIADLSITTTKGERVLRPMGLTDTPGGAATAGFYAVLFALGLFVTDSRMWMKCAAIGSMMVGTMCLYLCQVRSILVMAAICVIVFGSLLAWKGRIAKISSLAIVLVAVVFGSFSWAVSLAGDSVYGRLSTLVASSPTEVYYKSRGIFLEYTVNEILPEYPLGAGLGRWGMMSSYFGASGDPSQKGIYVEIQWTGWILDGGLGLVLAYVAAIFMTTLMGWKIMKNSKGEDMAVWGALLIAYNVGAFAITFNYPFFASQSGMEFWLLNAIIFSAAQTINPFLTGSKRSSL